MDAVSKNKWKEFFSKIKIGLKNKYALTIGVLVLLLGATGVFVFANQQTTATPNGIWLSISDIKKLPTSGPAWENVKKAADMPLGQADISNQESNHDIHTYAAALVYARTGDQAYRTKAANAVMSAVGSEQGGRTLALAWNLSAYVIAADLINLPDYNASQNATFVSWLKGVRNVNLDGKTLISTHEERPNNWGTGAGASRVAADIYLNDRADLDKASKVFQGWLGDRTAYSGFSYGELSFQCDPSNPVGVNPAGCKKQGIDIDGAIPDDMRRGGPFKEPPTPTHYPWTALQGAVAQAQMFSRQGYASYSWSNQAVKRAVQYLYDLSNRAGSSWWATNTAAKWVPWVVNSSYGANYPTTSNEDWGRVMNFTDWTHATPTQQNPDDTQAPTTPTNLKTTSTVEKKVQLTWGPSTDNVTVTAYEVSRDTTVLGLTGGTTYTDTTAAANQTYTYKVRAFDAAGNASQSASLAVTVTPAPAVSDTTKPAVNLTRPANNATITTESTPVSFTATDNVGVTKIEFIVDGQVDATISEVNGRTSFNANWNTKASGNGVHTLEVRAFDAAGNAGMSNKATITVAIPGGSNPTPPPNPGSGQVIVAASADARVSKNNASKNYGTEDFLRVRNYGNESWKSILKFEVSGLSGKPKSVKLRLFANDGGPDAGTLHLASNSWTEAAVNWNNIPAFTSGNRIGKATTVSVNDQSWVEFDITNKVTGNGTYSLGLFSDDDNSVYYSSREGKNKPSLVIVK